MANGSPPLVRMNESTLGSISVTRPKFFRSSVIEMIRSRDVFIDCIIHNYIRFVNYYYIHKNIRNKVVNLQYFVEGEVIVQLVTYYQRHIIPYRELNKRNLVENYFFRRLRMR